MRTHGWGGSPPADDAQAIGRILDAARRCFDEKGADTGIADVARALGVTRQTIYRYFPSTEDLLVGAAVGAASDFLDRLAAHVAPFTDPGAAVVEAIAYTLERLPSEPYLSLLLASRRTSTFAVGVTSATAMALGRSILERFPVDWPGAGFADDSLTDLVEYLLRTIQSFVLDPGHPPRTGDELRRYLDRWIAPSVAPGYGAPPLLAEVLP
ncbi:MAG TPA: TetR/AcrR family transcriptional regulator [Streptosporangiaceae bacterium]